ncbi:hypothetical protein [Deinococcus aerophilus]|uniref:Uncharacterized protein n=1 Tax=Deinococcus aerophilus TaxID=522488 RepID=A0ABQ2GHI7_9DEIO|nr:hypothetical protein [Deinococcus aerophilus]GGL95739.1 hypothetical protein GCM10010841_00160 [Deinococcus aerophilus]
MTVFYLLLTLAFAGVLGALLWRPGAARATVVWGLAGLLPLLAALTSAVGAQNQAARVLGTYQPRAVGVVITNGVHTQGVVLDPQDAACVERALRLRSKATLMTPAGPVPLNSATRVTGQLPPQAAVEALTVRGELNCPHLRATRE